ncbi:type II secretion system minor pseudopilin GspI [Luminiphilus syltensis]|uniref:type II secretion system minor pseudopilin GspI n=1 Tax=Luminiphilus syltensis TaxID=1341119 RepID=UPI00058D14D3
MSALKRNPERGFTLVEVMVALTVVAVALPALVFGLMQQIDGTAYMRDRSVASLVASNVLAEFRLIVAQEQTLSLREASGEVRMLDRDWYWWMTSQATDVPGFFRVEISVDETGDDDGTTLHTLTALIAPERVLVN